MNTMCKKTKNHFQNYNNLLETSKTSLFSLTYLTVFFINKVDKIRDETGDIPDPDILTNIKLGLVALLLANSSVLILKTLLILFSQRV